jgi:CRISPR-associated protein Cas5d
MLWDMDFVSDPEAKQIEFLTHDSTGGKVTKGTAKPKFFRAKLEKGVMKVPEVAV